METPLSMRRVTRSQARSASRKQKNKHYESSRSISSGNNDRAVFQDITNDSPINGVAKENSPFSSAAKNGALPKKTPGSGEALLRGQVKILLEKVEEGAEAINKLSNRQPAPFFPGLGILPISPGLLAAPTPANTPQIFTNSRVKEETGDNEKSAEFQECVLNRGPLVHLFNSPNESEASDISSTVSSSVTYQGSVVCSSYDDNWSIQANASACAEDEEVECDEFEEDTDNDDDDEKEHDGENEEEYLDELCEGLRKITVEDREAKLPEFTGKHTRFIYNSDDEIEEEEEIVAPKAQSPSMVVLKGLPVPEGKHLRFHEEDEE
ncbi:hypothetical protein KSP40_PGU006953 [Platanthera guangdongensis]|uniref:Uncharacterized protein n=1 Tax=Platanthera guangdongensis TaxID=2320717 RepID=A0ABR2LLY5_9ASPA